MMEFPIWRDSYFKAFKKLVFQVNFIELIEILKIELFLNLKVYFLLLKIIFCNKN